MRAMTWWDHDTNSIWSQPWGRAIRGELKGIELFLLPSELTTWGSWKAEHPDTLGSMHNLAILYQDQGKYDQAESLQTKALEIIQRVMRPEHPGTRSGPPLAATATLYRSIPDGPLTSLRKLDSVKTSKLAVSASCTR